MKRAIAVAGAITLLAGCGGRGEAQLASRGKAVPDWRAVATSADRARLRQWRSAWLDAVARARTGGAAPDMAAQGALFDPDHTLADAVPPAGDYRCRVFKLGAKGVGVRDYVAYPRHICQVEGQGGVIGFRTSDGSQRPVGRIFTDGGGRGVFLGTMMLGDERRATAYGRDAARNMAGFVERIGERRWRIVLPLPSFESTLDVIELVPVN